MIKQKKATDRALYRRALKAVENGDMSMKPVVEWWNRGKQPKPKGTQAHRDARDVVVSLLKDHTNKEVADMFDTYSVLIYRLKESDFGNVPEWKAQEIIELNRYRQAQQRLRAEYETKTYKQIAKDYGLSADMVSNCVRDYYKTPHKTIIEAVYEG